MLVLIFKCAIYGSEKTEINSGSLLQCLILLDSMKKQEKAIKLGKKHTVKCIKTYFKIESVIDYLVQSTGAFINGKS